MGKAAVRFVLVFVLSTLVSSAAQAQLRELLTDLWERYERGREVYDFAEELDGIIRDAENNRRPQPRDERVRDFVSRADGVAKQIREFDYMSRTKSPAVNFPALRRCETRELEVKKLDDLLGALEGAKNDGGYYDEQIGNSLAANRKLQDLMLDAIKRTEKITGNPFVPELNFLWWDLDKAARAVSDIGNALTERRKTLTRERAEVERMLGNATSNVRMLKAAPCVPASAPVAARETYGPPVPPDLREPFTPAPTQPSIALPTVPVPNVSRPMVGLPPPSARAPAPNKDAKPAGPQGPATRRESTITGTECIESCTGRNATAQSCATCRAAAERGDKPETKNKPEAKKEAKAMPNCPKASGQICGTQSIEGGRRTFWCCAPWQCDAGVLGKCNPPTQ